MRGFVGGDEYVLSQMYTPPPELEPTIRRAVDAVFQDLAYTDANDTDLTSSYLESITDPLEVLRENGLAIFAIDTK